MLYGEGDFGKTVDISTRCGQDSDCNPASAGGILGAMIGYERIPDYWKQGLDQVEDMDFKYTTISLNDVYDMSFRHALEMIAGNGGKEGEKEVIIPLEHPIPVKYEKAFEGHFPVGNIALLAKESQLVADGNIEYGFEFDGNGFVIRGRARKLQGITEEKELKVDLYIDDELVEEILLPTLNQIRRHDIAWKYHLEDGDHEVRIQWKDPSEGYMVELTKVIVYGPEPAV